MNRQNIIERLERAISEFKEALEFDERSAVIQSLIEDLEQGGSAPQY